MGGGWHYDRLFNLWLRTIKKCIIICILTQQSVSGAEYKFTINVEASKVECFWQPVIDNFVSMEIDYMVAISR